MDVISIILFFLLLFAVLSGIFVVKQQTAAIVERFGRFLVIRQSGLHIKVPLVDRIAGRVSLRILPKRSTIAAVCCLTTKIPDKTANSKRKNRIIEIMSIV